MLRTSASLTQEIQSHYNRLTFGLRQHLKWGKTAYCEVNEDKNNLFEQWQADEGLWAVYQHLIGTYPLQSLYGQSTRARYAETLSYLHVLDWVQGETGLLLPSRARWLDVGAKNWSYVESLYRFLEIQSGGEFTLEGVELDAYRRYQDGFIRRAYAEAFIQSLPNAHYYSGDFMDWQGEYDCITSFLPFVFADPLLAWGLPLNFFEPAAFLKQCLALLVPGGQLLVVNQGELEANEQRCLFESLALPSGEWAFQALGPCPNTFLNYRHTRYASLVQRLI